MKINVKEFVADCLTFAARKLDPRVFSHPANGNSWFITGPDDKYMGTLYKDGRLEISTQYGLIDRGRPCEERKEWRCTEFSNTHDKKKHIARGDDGEVIASWLIK